MEFNGGDIDFVQFIEDLNEKDKKQALFYFKLFNIFHDDLTQRLDRIEKLLSPSNDKTVVIVEEMDHDEAIIKIKKYMKDHDTTDIEELHHGLGIKIELLIDILDELISEGKIIEG